MSARFKLGGVLTRIKSSPPGLLVAMEPCVASSGALGAGFSFASFFFLPNAFCNNKEQMVRKPGILSF